MIVRLEPLAGVTIILARRTRIFRLSERGILQRRAQRITIYTLF